VQIADERSEASTPRSSAGTEKSYKVLRLSPGAPRYQHPSVTRYQPWKGRRTGSGDILAEKEWPDNKPEPQRMGKKKVPEYYAQLADPMRAANKPPPVKVMSPYKARDYVTDVYNVGTDPLNFKEEKDKQPPRKDPPQNTDPKNPFNRAQTKAMVQSKLFDLIADTGPERLAGLNSHQLGCIDERILYEVVPDPLKWERDPVYPVAERTRGTVLNNVEKKLALVGKDGFAGLRRVKTLEGYQVDDWDHQIKHYELHNRQFTAGRNARGTLVHSRLPTNDDHDVRTDENAAGPSALYHDVHTADERMAIEKVDHAHRLHDVDQEEFHRD
jgi:hypothetical protein